MSLVWRFHCIFKHNNKMDNYRSSRAMYRPLLCTVKGSLEQTASKLLLSHTGRCTSRRGCTTWVGAETVGLSTKRRREEKLSVNLLEGRPCCETRKNLSIPVFACTEVMDNPIWQTRLGASNYSNTQCIVSSQHFSLLFQQLRSSLDNVSLIKND